MSNSNDDAVPGPSKAKDDAVPGPSNAEDDPVSGPSNADDDAVPGPSNAEDDPVSGPSNADNDVVSGPSKEKTLKARPIMKTVSFSKETLSSSTEKVKCKTGKSSMIGTAGYVCQLVEELETEESEEALAAEDAKPIRMQSIEDRRCSIKNVEAEIGNYLKSVARMSIAEKKSTSKKQLPTVAQEKLEEITAFSGTDIAADVDERTTSEWLPSQILGDEHREKIQRSWVGTYIVGKDYWDDVEEEEESEKEARKARYSTDENSKTWYEMPVPKTSRMQEVTYLDHKKEALKNIKELKDDLDKEFRYKREQRELLAAVSGSRLKPFEEWTDNFKMNFKEVSKEGEFSHQGTHMTMANADKWLENAGILDHRKLTLIHTGYCFLASGGSRNRGLSFTEFIHFLQMVSYTNGMPLRDIAKRLEVCLRKAPPAD